MNRWLWGGATLLLLAGCATSGPKKRTGPVDVKKSSGSRTLGGLSGRSTSSLPSSPVLKSRSSPPVSAPAPSGATPVFGVDTGTPVSLETKGTPATDAPVVLAPWNDLGDFNLLANGGFNANWYVGHNTCWVHRLPPAPPGNYQRAFIGAKLGAMKTEARPGRPTWERQVIPGEISIGISDAPAWPQSRRYLLARTESIPLEGDTNNALDGVGESRWFWVEVPLKSVSWDSDNYIALYSPDAELRDAAHAPILAAGPSNGVIDTWLNNNVHGQPALTAAEALKTPVGSYEPAVALKLVPARETSPTVSWRSPSSGRAEVNPRLVLDARVSGEDIECAWVEISTDTRSWRPWGRPRCGAPYTFTLSRESLPSGSVHVRVTAKDLWENTGTTPPLVVRVPRK